MKYHSTDSNIVASGCLGYEVRTRNTKREREEVRGKQGQNDVDGIDERTEKQREGERNREREIGG